MAEPAVCSLCNLRDLYVTQTEARALVGTWSVLLALGISLEDPLSGAIVARKLFHGGIKLVQVVRTESSPLGNIPGLKLHPWSNCTYMKVHPH